MAANYDDFGYRRRKPWLLLILIVVAAVVVLQRVRVHRGGRVSLRRQPAPEATNRGSASTPAPDAAGQAGALTNLADQSRRRIAEAQKLESKNDLLGARRILEDALAGTNAPRDRAMMEQKLGKINIGLIMSPGLMPEKTEYTVQSGDTLEKIANRFGTTRLLIEKSNGITNPDIVRVGKQLRVFTAKFALAISKSRNDMVLSANGKFFKRYCVGTGEHGKTPAGTFVISDKIPQPVWWKNNVAIPYGDKENILGTHWMSLKATGETPDLQGYGIHGTWDDSSVGKSLSAGCVRLVNQDVEELFVLLPVGTPVTIAE